MLDRALTRQVLQAGQLLGPPVLDHLILGTGSYVSLHGLQALQPAEARVVMLISIAKKKFFKPLTVAHWMGNHLAK
jgi:hypothetical protein